MKHASVIGHAAAVAVPSALALTLGWLYVPVVFSTLLGSEPASGAERESWLAIAAIGGLLVGATLIGVALLRRRRHLRRHVAAEAHACGSCGRSYHSQRELKQHQAAVHAPRLLARSAYRRAIRLHRRLRAPAAARRQTQQCRQ
jgi:hypothetical protein